VVKLSNRQLFSQEKLEEIGTSARAAREKAETQQTILKNSVTSFSKKYSVSHRYAIQMLKRYHDQQEIDRLKNIFKTAQSIDLCFVLDATGSMAIAQVFQALKNNIRQLIEVMRDCAPYLEYQLSVVAYRDPEDGAGHFEILPFTTSRTEFEIFLANIRGAGGGDQCEDVLGGLKVASGLEWKCYNRLLFLCGDAPCHGTQYHEGCGDSHPEGLRSVSSKEILHKLVEKQVQMFFWKVNHTTDKMILEFNKEASTSPGRFAGDRDRSCFIETVHIDTANANTILASVKDSISEASSRSFSKSSSRASGLKQREIKNTLNNLEKIEEEEEGAYEISAHMKKASLSPEGTLRAEDGSRI
jgi:hypothetical protein